ncbi:MAG: lipid A phosphoethanolamine transferase [Prevotella sp.]|nr:lipid A phosphoethanolamine transferase [Bacteroides sp.]MCM1366153.1 lipid A phosphoethanolamine transferase [Prevotella sp.]MCM1436782.1 lipid A phosphoethanolamine transferase [Prevotella sp.]
MDKKFPIYLYFAFILSLIIPNVWLSLSDNYPIFTQLCNIILPLGLIAIIAASSIKIGRTIWFSFPLIFFAAFQIVLLILFGNGVIAVDMFLNLATTNSKEVTELLGNMLLPFITVVVFYLLILFSATLCGFKKWTLKSPFIKKGMRSALIITCCGLLILPLAHFKSPDFSIKKDIYPFNVIYNLSLAIDRVIKTSHYSDTSQNFSYNARLTHQAGIKEIYILVIGETSRGDHWGIGGYKRNTTPYLSQRNDIIYSSDALSESNTTHKSVPMLLSPVSSESFNTDIYKVKSLISAFKEAGFATAFISDQMPNNSFIDFFANEADTTDYVRLANEDIKIFSDQLLINPLQKILSKNNNKQLIVLHTYGSHFNYRDRYSKENARFLPDDYADITNEFRPKLVNAYDNTIITTDKFLNDVITQLESQNCISALIYTSDHGEDLYDDGKSFLHASLTPSIHQLHVPLFTWLSPQYSMTYPVIRENLIKNFAKPISTSRSICPSIIGIAGIKTDKINPSDDLSSSKFKPHKRIYLNDHNKPIENKNIISNAKN